MSGYGHGSWRITKRKVSFAPSGIYLNDICVARKVGLAFETDTAQTDVLRKVVGLLNSGRTAEAIFLLNFTPVKKANFNPAEPRDRIGWWTTQADSATSPITEVQYRGHFHNLVVDDLIRGLNAHGGNAIAHVEVSGINGVVAIPDGASLPSGWKTPYFIEVKTGDDPSFTPNQMQVYPLICMGGHATSFDPRISDIGLKPGAPLPPMDIMVVHTLGPGQPMSFLSYCKLNGVGGRR